MNASKDPRTTDELLRIARFAPTLAIRQELERRGCVCTSHCINPDSDHCREREMRAAFRETVK